MTLEQAEKYRDKSKVITAWVFLILFSATGCFGVMMVSVRYFRHEYQASLLTILFTVIQWPLIHHMAKWVEEHRKTWCPARWVKGVIRGWLFRQGYILVPSYYPGICRVTAGLRKGAREKTLEGLGYTAYMHGQQEAYEQVAEALEKYRRGIADLPD